jgi:hypothetical protein
MPPNQYVLFNEYMPYKRSLYFIIFFPPNFSTFSFHINSLELTWHLNPSSTILPHLQYQHFEGYGKGKVLKVNFHTIDI